MISTSDEIQNYIVGTNSSPRNVAEAKRQGIVSPNEELLGIFDGVLYEAGNKRIGGLALNDFLIVTDQNITLWARDQYRDIVDRFPLSHVFVLERKQKDSQHAFVKLGLALPDTSADALDKAELIQLTFDLVPLDDLELLAGVIDVLGCAHRDLIKGGAKQEDCYRAARVLFSQVFLSKMMASASKPGRETMGRTYDLHNEPLVEIIEDSEAEALMTPLSRLDKLDSFNTRYEPQAPRQQGRLQYEPPTQAQARLYQPKPENQGYFATSASGQAPQIEQELRWLGGAGNPPSGQKRGNPNANRDNSQLPPGVRLKEDLSNSDAFYFVNRAGRSVFDGLDKLRKEAEAKNAGLLPLLNAARESGMNIRDITEFVMAANELLDTIGHNPAARELAMMFAGKMLNDNNGKLKQTMQAASALRSNKGPVQVENAEEPAPVAPAPRPGRVKVERRSKPQPVLEVEDGGSEVSNLTASQTDLSVAAEAPVLNLQAEPASNLQEESRPIGGSQTRLPDVDLDSEPFREAALVSSTASQTKIFEPEMAAKPPRHRLTIRSSNVTAGAADGGGLDIKDDAGSVRASLDLAAPSGPDLN